MPSATFRGINLKLPAGAFREAIKRESPKRKRANQQDSDPTGPVQEVDYGSDEFGDALGEFPVLITPDGQARILPPGATPTEHPDTMGAVAEWDRAGIVNRFVGRPTWQTAVKAGNAEAAEWDHVALSLSRQAGEEATPEQVKAAVAILTEVLRTPPLRFTRDGDPETYQRWLAEKRITRGDVLGIDGHRMVHVLPIHDDTDNVHVQVFVHRHPIDVDKREVGAAIKQHEPVVSRAQVAAMNALFQSNGLPFNITNGFERVNAGQGATLDAEQAAEVVQVIQDAGGVAPARLTTGMQGQMAGAVAAPTVEPDAQRIAASIDEDAQALARMKADMDALAARIAAKQNAVAAIQEAAAARAAQTSAEAQARAAEAAREAAQADLDQAHAEIAQVRAEAVQAAEQAAQEAAQAAEALLREQERSERAERLAVELQEVARGEPERTALAVTAEVDPLRAEVAQVRADLVAERQAREEAVAELAKERETFVDRATKWAEENLMGPVRRELADAKAGLETAEATIREQAARILAIPGEIATAVREAEERMEARIASMVQAAVAGVRNAAAAPFQAAGEAIRAKTPEEQEAARNKAVQEAFERNDAIRQAALDAGTAYADLDSREKRAVLAVWSQMNAWESETDANPNLEDPEQLYTEQLAARAPKALNTPDPEPLALPAPQEVQETPAPVTTLDAQASAPEAVQKALAMPPKGQEFYRVSPDQWTPEQRNQAEARLETDRQKAKTPARQAELAARTVEQHGEAAYNTWLAKQAPKFD